MPHIPENLPSFDHYDPEPPSSKPKSQLHKLVEKHTKEREAEDLLMRQKIAPPTKASGLTAKVKSVTKKLWESISPGKRSDEGSPKRKTSEETPPSPKTEVRNREDSEETSPSPKRTEGRKRKNSEDTVVFDFDEENK